MLAVGHAGKRGERLALGAGAQHDDLVVVDAVNVEGVDDVLVGDVEVAELAGDLGVVDHGAARHHDLAAHGDGGVADLLQAVDVAREGRDEDAALGVLDDVAQVGADRGLGLGEAGPGGVGGVGQQQVDAQGAELADCLVVGTTAVNGRLVELEVARMDEGAGRGVHEDAERARDGVSHGKEREVEGAQRDVGAILDLAELGLADVVLLQLAGNHAQGELGGVDGHLAGEVHEQVRQGARVVLVAVGDDDAAELVLVLQHVGVVGKDEVDAGLVVLGEHQAGVYQDHVVAVLEGRHVLADAVESAERDDLQCRVFLGHSYGIPFVCAVQSICTRS